MEHNSNNLIHSDYLDQGGPETLSTTWQQKGGRLNTPSNGAKVRLELWLQLSSGWVAFDDVSLASEVAIRRYYYAGGARLLENPAQRLQDVLAPHLAADPHRVSLLLVGHGIALRNAGLAELRAAFQHSRRMGL